MNKNNKYYNMLITAGPASQEDLLEAIMQNVQVGIQLIAGKNVPSGDRVHFIDDGVPKNSNQYVRISFEFISEEEVRTMSDYNWETNGEEYQKGIIEAKAVKEAAEVEEADDAPQHEHLIDAVPEGTA